MTRKFNPRRLAISLVAVLMFAGLVHLGHAFQVRRNAGIFLDQAERAAAAGEAGLALQSLDRYLTLRPGDNDALVKYVELLQGESANRKQAARVLELMEQVLRRQPDRQAVRRKLVRQAVELREFSLAREHLGVLLQTEARDSELAYLEGRCLEADGQPDQAANAYRKAVQLFQSGPVGDDEIACHLRLAELQRRALKQPDESASTLQALIQRAPEHAPVLLLRAEQAGVAGNWQEARRLLSLGIEKYPQDPRMYLALAEAEARSQRPQEAVAALQQGLETLRRPPLDWLTQVADLLLDANQVQLARQAIARLDPDVALPALLEHFQGRLLFAEERWLEASRKLEAARPQLIRDTSLVKKTDLALGVCYENLGNRDQQVAVYRRALTVDPLFVPARLALAGTLSSLGKFDEALEEYRRVPEPTGAVKLAMAQLLVLRTLRAPAAERRWAEASEAIQQIAAALPDSVEALALQVEVLAAQGKPAEAKQRIEAFRGQHPKELQAWLLLANLADHQKQHDQAQALLDEAGKEFGDSATLRLARARHLLQVGGRAAAGRLAELERNADGFSAGDRLRLERGLAEAYVALGAGDEARRVWQRVARRQENDVRVWLVLFELDLPAGGDGALQEYRDRIKALEGADGVLWRWCEAARLIRQAERDKTRGNLEQAQELLAEVAKRRPAWRGTLLLTGRIHELRGNPDGAIEQYQEAIQAGEKRAELIARTAQLLFERRRFAEADELIRRLPDQELLGGELGRLAADLAYRNQNPRRALELAKAVAARSTAARDHAYLGQLYWSAQQKEEADQAFRKATELGEQSSQPWIALVLFLAGSDRKAEAEQTIEIARQKLPAAEAALALGPCFEAIGKLEAADQHYQAAVQAQPRDIAAWRNLAQFYLRTGEAGKAVAPLRTLLGLAEGNADLAGWTRRNLALVLLRTNRPVEESLALLDENAKVLGDNPADSRARALLLSASPHRQAEAIALLEKLNARQALLPGDLFLLVQLYEGRQDWAKARERMLSLLASQGDNPRYVAHYVQSLIQQDELAQADVWLGKLEKLEPNGTSLVVLRTRQLQAAQRTAEAVAQVQKWADSKEGRPELAALLLDNLNEPALAEPYYRKHLIQSKQPEAILPLAQNLARQKRVGDALDLCDQAWQTCAPESVAAASVAVLRAGPASPEQVRRVEERLERARGKSGGLMLLLSLADLRDLQERFDDAAALYREVLKKDARNLVALNNLAWILALKEGRQDEALQTINAAIQAAGPLPALLDTRAVILVSLGQPQPALQDLRTAISQQPTAVRHFHLARANLLAGNRAAARKELAKANDLGLKTRGVHPLEKGELEKLTRALGG